MNNWNPLPYLWRDIDFLNDRREYMGVYIIYGTKVLLLDMYYTPYL